METLPGFRDFFPSPVPTAESWSMGQLTYLFSKWRNTARTYGFSEYDGPPLEPLELYTRKSGQEIVGQLYNFEDKGERSISLRPEITPTVARMIAGHARNYKKPMKWFSIPQLFRYERQQKGRLREHFQFNADIFGEPGVGGEAEIIALLIDTLRAFGLTEDDFRIRLSSRQAWQHFFDARCSGSQDADGFFQIIDKMERADRAGSEKKLGEFGVSIEEVERFIREGEPTEELREVCLNLENRGLGGFVEIDYQVIRGLAYYTGTVFEAFDRKGEFRAIAGGGRYDRLVHQVTRGSVDLCSLGFGMGDVVLSELLKARGLMPEFFNSPDVYVAIESEDYRLETMQLVQNLRNRGMSVEYPLSKMKPNKQFKRAMELKASFFAQLDSQDPKQVRVKCLKSREEKVVPLLNIDRLEDLFVD
ncbi:MAG TPA: histidine--tRNA ligase [Verrucomicrobiales bacterium]|nr:histidine--tRNA ligase [Verrucomicrobiales bacterium]